MSTMPPSLTAPGDERSPWQRWKDFWFSAADPTTLGFIRICTGLLVLYIHLAYSLDLGTGLGRPEGATKECAFLALERVAGPVAVHQPAIISKALFGRVDRGQHSGIVGGKEPHQGQH